MVNVKKNKEKTGKVSLALMGIGAVCALIILGGFGYFGAKIHCLQGQIKAQQAEIDSSKKIYVYNLEEVLRSVNAGEAKTQFESEIIKLNDEVFAAEKKIKSLKDAKVKEDFSDIYLNNLKMKRDELVANYEKKIKEITDGINNALGLIAKEKDVSVIFVQSSIAVKTPYVVDVTPDIVKRIKEK